MRRWLAFLRIAVGLLYLYAFVRHISGGLFATLAPFLQTLARHNTLPVTGRLLEAYVIPHSGLLAWLILIGELLAGLFLLVGLATRVVAMAAILMQALYLLAALGSDTLPMVANGLFIAAILVIFGTAGGWRWSLDEMIVNRR